MIYNCNIKHRFNNIILAIYIGFQTVMSQAISNNIGKLCAIWRTLCTKNLTTFTGNTHFEDIVNHSLIMFTDKLKQLNQNVCVWYQQ